MEQKLRTLIIFIAFLFCLQLVPKFHYTVKYKTFRCIEKLVVLSWRRYDMLVGIIPT